MHLEKHNFPTVILVVDQNSSTLHTIFYYLNHDTVVHKPLGESHCSILPSECQDTLHESTYSIFLAQPLLTHPWWSPQPPPEPRGTADMEVLIIPNLSVSHYHLQCHSRISIMMMILPPTKHKHKRFRCLGGHLIILPLVLRELLFWQHIVSMRFNQRAGSDTELATFILSELLDIHTLPSKLEPFQFILDPVTLLVLFKCIQSCKWMASYSRAFKAV